MKVVINKCFGGFGLSPLAMVELIKLGSPIIESYPAIEYYGGNNPKIDRDWKANYERDLTAAVNEIEGYKFGLFSTLYKDEMVYNYKRADEFRTDPLLVKVVKKLGKRANGYCADLKIIDVPVTVKFQIEEYDGLEHIAEVHQTWG